MQRDMVMRYSVTYLHVRLGTMLNQKLGDTVVPTT